MTNNVIFITRSALATRWSKSSRTIKRFEVNPPDGFPQPLRIGGRTHFKLDEVEAFERLQVSRASLRAA